ncbi:MAG TPA: adenosylcobinamide-GDP ribazoletransferase [Ilumatobacteraceae bacterium]|nr:adenosylcobinamide-GDP ribazoletransferase [Ilumatobacteraceae bacterium]
MKGLLGAIQFLTRVPIRMTEPPKLTRCVPWFPLVGGLIGLAVGGIAAGLAELVPMAVAAAVAIVAGVLITGAFHEDGLADIADAFGGGWTREQRLRILEDPLHGTYGVAALGSSIVIRVLCVASLTPPSAFAGLVAAHTLGRSAAVGAMATFPLALPSGLGAGYRTGLSRWRAFIGVLGGVAIATVAIGWWVAPLAAAGVVAAAAVGVLALRKIGGVTGDVLGAVEQVTECLVLVVLAGLASRHTLWWRT